MNLIQSLSAQPWVERLGWTLVHFLWQGLSIAGLYAIARGRMIHSQNAQARYVLACVALAAMLIAPVVTFVAAGPSNHVPGPVSLAGVPLAPAVNGPGAGSVPFASLSSTAPPAWRDELMPWLVMTWFAGAIGVWVRLIGGCVIASGMKSRRVQTAPAPWNQVLDALRVRVRVSTPVRLLISTLVHVPTVVGWLKPAILVPVGALTGLAVEQVEALLAHELAHIRRRDYLVNVLQGVAEAMLFYHPAIWWVSGHIRLERELCCDDIAVALNGDTLTYASALASVESHRRRHLVHSLAANGGSLPDRIARLLGQPQTPAGHLPGPAALISGILLAAAACGLWGQVVDARPSFEVASLKPEKTETGVDRIQFSKGSLIIENVSLKRLIGMAYGVAEGRDYLFSGPDWLDSERFDISAKFPTGTTNPDALLMLQRLLDERFQLKLYREAREFPVYALVVAKGGPKLQPAARPGAYRFSAQGGHATAMSLSMPQLADRLSRPAFSVGRQVVDFTGLTGTYDLTLDWRPEGDPAQNPTDDLSRPSIFSALSEQLGLKLEPRKTSLDVLVVDRALRVPTEN